jgi:hypothetical protein
VKEVLEAQEIDAQMVVATVTVGVGLDIAKLMPSTVRAPPLESGPFMAVISVITGVSYVNDADIVPTRVAMVETGNWLVPTPYAVSQLIDESEVHDSVEQDVDPILADALRSLVAKFIPTIVTEVPPLLGPLLGRP